MKLRKMLSSVLVAVMALSAIVTPAVAEDSTPAKSAIDAATAQSIEEFTALTGIEIEILEGEEAEEYINSRKADRSADIQSGLVSLSFESSEPTGELDLTGKYATGCPIVPAGDTLYASEYLYFNHCNDIGITLTPLDDLSGEVTAVLQLTDASPSDFYHKPWKLSVTSTIVLKIIRNVSDYELTTLLSLENSSGEDRELDVTVSGE